jgi:hypothetical protein
MVCRKVAFPWQSRAVTSDEARALALSFEGATERDHHGFPSYRRRTIFATQPKPTVLHVLLPEEAILDAVAENPDWCAEKWWGKKLSALQVDLVAADPAVVRELLEDAWRLHA